MYASDGGATSRFIGLALSPRPTIAGFLLEPDLGTGQFKVSKLPAEPTVCGQVQSEGHNKSWEEESENVETKTAASEGEIKALRNRRV